MAAHAAATPLLTTALRSCVGKAGWKVRACRAERTQGPNDTGVQARTGGEQVEARGLKGKVRLGVLGAGNIADMNVAGYLEHPNCDVVAVCDVDVHVAERAAQRWGAPTVYASQEELFADERVDAVEVLTPTHMHHAHVTAALKAGKHVSVQKPIANSVDEAIELGRLAEMAGLTLRVSECFVHYPPLELAKALITSGAIGKPIGIRVRTVVGQTDSAFQAALPPAVGY